MLTLPPGTKVFLATSPVDGRKGIDGLSALVRSQFGQDPLSGHMFVFFSRRADRVRVLYWDRDGYVLIQKRLELGRYRVSVRPEASLQVSRWRSAICRGGAPWWQRLGRDLGGNGRFRGGRAAV